MPDTFRKSRKNPKKSRLARLFQYRLQIIIKINDFDHFFGPWNLEGSALYVPMQSDTLISTP